MVRALEKYFGTTPDLDIEAQRAILVLKRPVAIDWKAVDNLVKRANYTFGGAHLRARGRVTLEDEAGVNTLIFEFGGSGQKIEVKNQDLVRAILGQPGEFAVRVENWKKGPAHLVLLRVP